MFYFEPPQFALANQGGGEKNLIAFRLQSERDALAFQTRVVHFEPRLKSGAK